MTAISENNSDREPNPDQAGETRQVSLRIRTVSSDAPMRWLEKGVADFRAMLVPSFLTGMVYVIVGIVMMWAAWSYPIFVTTLAAGFLIIGPLVAVGFYCMSSELEKGNRPNMRVGTLLGWQFMKRNFVSLSSFAMMLAVLMGAWALVSAVTVALFMDSIVVGRDFLDTLIRQHNLVPFFLVYVLTGGVIAVIAFSISVIAAPLITDRQVDFVTAMITSVEAVKKNPKAMATWAFMIAAMVVLGFLFGVVGLAVTLPIVGHASWHVYRDLVEAA
ncbi:MAG TPA: DUF2189 domain-containing protein [Thiolinea sp.]|nr:DUF2189 domain-containing protein [Thiolinea sp.]